MQFMLLNRSSRPGSFRDQRFSLGVADLTFSTSACWFPRYTLLPWGGVDAVVEVLDFMLDQNPRFGVVRGKWMVSANWDSGR